jgi:glyoxylase-like metal-dependent hydrolase (beta-lactamase superfamily II)
MIDPARLLSSAARLYGGAMDQLWGEFRSVPKQNITTLQGGETIDLGNHTLHVYDAPGHASHHVIYFEDQHGIAFVGDTAGVRIPGAPSVRPPTPPPDIDLEAWRSTLDQLRALNPNTLLLTHFGPVSNPLEHIEDFYARLLRWAETVREGLNSGEDEQTQIARLRALAEADFGPDNQIAEQSQYASPIEQSWQGLARYWRKRMERSQTTNQ